MTQGKISDKIHQRLISTGSQPASLYGLAKVHKKDTTLENLNGFLTPFVHKLPGANTQKAREALESLTLEDDEQIVSLDVKGSYNNVPDGEVIEIALRELYLSNLAPYIPRSAMKKLLKLAVTNVLFKCNGIWYVQSDGLATGASLAVIRAKVWMKSFEASLQKPEFSENNSRSDQNGKCKDCNRRVTFRGRGVECESCKNWFSSKTQRIANEEYTNMRMLFVFVLIAANNRQWGVVRR